MSLLQFILVAIAGAFLIATGSRRISGKARRRGPLYQWFARKLKLRSPEVRAKLLKDWDYAQVDDSSVLNADPNLDRAREAASLHTTAPETALRTLLELAEGGSVWSMLWVAWCYHHGAGVTSDLAQSEAWFRRAFEAGSRHALLEYGSLHLWRRDFDTCEAVFGVEAANGWAPAEYWLAVARFRKSRTRATLREVRPLLDDAVSQGSPAAKYFLGYHLGRGWFGLRGIPAGLKLIREFSTETDAVLDAIKAADSGSASAQYRLGWIYAFGGNLAHSDQKAVELFNLSAAKGNADAMMAKGWMYAYGRGVSQDLLQAYAWSAAAAILIPETGVEERKVAIEIRDWAKPHLSRTEAAKARRMVKKLAPPRTQVTPSK